MLQSAVQHVILLLFQTLMIFASFLAEQITIFILMEVVPVIAQLLFKKVRPSQVSLKPVSILAQAILPQSLFILTELVFRNANLLL